VRSTPFERLSLSQRREILKVIGFLLRDMPESLMTWQATIACEKEEKRELPGAIAEILYDKSRHSHTLLQPYYQ
jgi:hypothetical protein